MQKSHSGGQFSGRDMKEEARGKSVYTVDVAVNGEYRRKSDSQCSDAVVNSRSLNRAKLLECSGFVHLHIECRWVYGIIMWISTRVNCRLYHDVCTKRQTQIHIFY
jgi:hypothetical protein